MTKLDKPQFAEVDRGEQHFEEETVQACPLCSSESTELLFLNYDRLYGFPGEFGTFKCANCGLVRISPRPTVQTMKAYYPDDYGPYNHTFFALEGRAGAGSFFRRFIRKSVVSHRGYDTGPLKLLHKIIGVVTTPLFHNKATYGYGDILPPFAPNGKVLEVGCGDGRFLAILKHLGWSVVGSDLSQIAAERARKNFDIEVFVGEVQNSPFKPASFDHIHLSHVLEHFYDPIGTLMHLKTLMKPNGTMFIEVPNGAGAEAEICGSFWYGWDAPRHLFMFSPDTLRKALEANQLEVTRLETMLCDTFEWTLTYEHEEQAGKRSSTRPMAAASDEERSKIQENRQRAKELFAKNKNKGDRILCWVKNSDQSSI